MLRVYEIARKALRMIAKLLGLIERRDPDLARQMRRAASSMALNIREGSQSQGRNRNARYWNAAGSANEVLGCLDCAEDLGYLEPDHAELRNLLNTVVGTLVRIVRNAR